MIYYFTCHDCEMGSSCALEYRGCKNSPPVTPTKCLFLLSCDEANWEAVSAEEYYKSTNLVVRGQNLEFTAG